MAVKCDPDSIYIDGMEGSTGAGPHLATEDTGVPGIAAIRQARQGDRRPRQVGARSR
jgi:methylamine---glutamate N-methyltransferase subunit C